MDRETPNQNDSQLIREAKIGFSIVLLVVSTVGYWGYSVYYKYRTQIPDHVINAPVAQMVGPDDYLRSLETQPPRYAQRLNNLSERRATVRDEVRNDRNNRQVNFVESAGEDVSKFQPIPPSKQTDFVPQNKHLDTRSEAPGATQPKETQPKPDLRTRGSKLQHREPVELSIGRDSTTSLQPRIHRKQSLVENNLVERRPMVTSQVSSDDNKNVVNVAKDRSDQLFVPSVRPEAQGEVSSGPTSIESVNAVSNSLRPTNEKRSNSLTQTNTLAMDEFQPITSSMNSADNAPTQTEVSGHLQDAKTHKIDQFDASQIVVDVKNPVEEVESSTVLSEPPGRQYNFPVHVSQDGESLWTIASRVYEDGRYFRALARHNEDLLGDKNKLVGNTQVETPSVEYLHENYSDDCPEDKLDSMESNRYYTTTEGDTLFGIARKVTGQASRYLDIYKLNRSRLPDQTNHLTRLPANIKLTLPQ